MVKRGTKRKIEIEKIKDKNSMATCFTKRSYGLYSKASQLCLASDAQIAVLATPSSSNSNVSFFSFGHSSVDGIVSAYLSGEKLAPVSIMDSKEMREDLGVCFERSGLGLGHWWEDEERFKNPQDITEGIESMKKLLSLAQQLRNDAMNVIDQNPNQREAKKRKKNKSDVVVLDHHGTDETLVNSSDVSEHDQILSASESLCNNNDTSTGELFEWGYVDFDEILTGSDDENQEEEEDHQISENRCSNNNNALLPEHQTQEEEDHHQIVDVSDSSCSDNNENNLDEWSDTDLDQLIDDCEEKSPENLNEYVVVNKAEEEDHQTVSVSENVCSSNKAHLLLPGAGNLDVTDLDFETIFEGLLSDEEFFELLTDEELHEFDTSFSVSA